MSKSARINYETAMGCLLKEKDTEPDNELVSILVEAAEFQASEIDGMSYLLKIEEFLDDCGVYAFPGWEDGIVMREPKIEKYWVTLELLFAKPVSQEVASHIAGRERDARVTFEEMEDGALRCEIKVMRRKLDEIEFRNKKNAKKDARPIAASPLSTPQSAGEVGPGGVGV